MDIPSGSGSGGTPSSGPAQSTPAASTSKAPASAPTQRAITTASPSVPAPKPGMKGVSDDSGVPAVGGETPAEKVARKYKIKVDGAESEVDLDTLKDEDVVRALQWERAARKRMEEKATIEKQFNSFVDSVKKDPFSALKDPLFGDLDVMKMAEERIIREFQEQQMPPEQRQSKDLERQLAAERAKIKEYEGKQQAEIERREEAQVKQHLENVFGEALSKSDLPKTHETMYMMAEVMRAALDAGIELSPEQMASEVTSRLRSLHGHVTKSLKGDALIKHLGPDVVKEVLNYSLAQARAKSGQQRAPVPAAQSGNLTENEKQERNRKNPQALKSFFQGK